MTKVIYQVQKLTNGGVVFIKNVSRKSKVHRAVERLRINDPKGVFIVSPVLKGARA